MLHSITMEEISDSSMLRQEFPNDVVTYNESNTSVNTGTNTSYEGSEAPVGYSMPHIILTSVLVSVIMFVIVFGNLLVVVAIFTDRTLKTTQNWFIASLAVADFLLGLVIMPFSLANEMMGYWYFGRIWCDLWKAIDVLLSTASILSICLISLDRYWSITRAITYSRQRTPTRAALMIAAVWFLSAVICVPPLIGWKNPLPVSNYPLCLLSDEIGYVLYSTMGSFYIPCVIMVFVYFKIYRAARKLARKNIKKKNKNKKNGHHDDFTSGVVGSTEKININDKSATINEPLYHNDNCKEKQNKVIKPKENSKLIKADSNTVSCGAISKLNETCHSVEMPYETSPNSGNKYELGTNGIAHKEHSDCFENVSNDGTDTRTSNLSINQDTHKTETTTCAIKCNKSDKTKGLCKLSDTLSKKRVRSNSNKQSSKNWRTSSLREHERQRRKLAKARERRATIVLGLVMAAFILCWFPFFTLYIITSFCYCIGEVLFAVAFWAGYCNSALNPIIYTIFNREFRQAFYKIICKRLCRFCK